MAKLIQYCTKASRFAGEFKWQAAGMGYILLTDGGRFLVIDGGHGEDAEGILALLEGNSAGKPAGRKSSLTAASTGISSLGYFASRSFRAARNCSYRPCFTS